MLKIVNVFICFLLCLVGTVIAQKPFISIPSEKGFKAVDNATSSFDPVNNTFHLVLQEGNTIYRRIYDTNFTLLEEYRSESRDITFSEKSSFKANYIAPLCTTKGYFELFSTGNGVLVYKPDFTIKKDSLYATFSFKLTKKGGEKLLSVIPDSDLKILTYARETNTLKIYQWSPGDSAKTYSFILPEKSMSKEEEKLYTKSSQIKLSQLWGSAFSAVKINSIQSLPTANHLYYSDNKFYIVIGTPNSVGRYVMSIDLDKNELNTHTYFINSLENAFVQPGQTNYGQKDMVSTVFDSTLVIQNSSNYRFEYYFYNINTHALIRKYSVPVKDSMYELVHSALTQKGTYASRDQEKDITRERAFMRKINGSFWYITLSALSPDSVVFTLAALKYTEGIGGTLLSVATASAGFMANIHIGNLQIIPYLTSSRYKLYYAHSRFSTDGFVPARDSTVTTALDQIIDTFEAKELASHSSFFIQKEEEAIIGVFNKETLLFDIYKFSSRR